jgi:curved DNA-binding protein CbpA
MSEENYYELLGATIESTQEEIRKCYKRRALDYHPDKIAGKPELVGMFEKCQKAYEFLTDETKKKTYDANIRAKMERQIQLQKQDVEVQRMRAELERKEKEAAEARAQGKDLNLKFTKRAPVSEKQTPEAKLLAAEEALKKKRAEFTRQQSAELIAEMTRAGQLQRRPSSKVNVKIPTQEDVKRTAAARAASQPPPTSLDSQDENTDKDRTITVRWKKKKKIREGDSDVPKGDYDEHSLRSLFRVYGRIAHIVVRQRRALIVFTHKDEALKATQSKTPAEGLRVNFFTASKSKSASSKSSTLSDNNSSENEMEQKQECSSTSNPHTPSASNPRTTSSIHASPSPSSVPRRPLSSIIDHENYESQTLLRMRRLMEQRRLQQQPQASAVVT